MYMVVANGARIPALGFGSYGMSNAQMRQLVRQALKAGFRHFDTAQIYGNEAGIGEGIVSFGIARAEVFITTKVWVSNYSPKRFAASVSESLENLRTDYIDLLLLHWPSNSVPLEEQIGGLNLMVDTGKVRYIGVSNFNSELMSRAVALSAFPLVTNQFEYHPYLNQSILIANTRRAGMAVTAYCGMAIGRIFSDLVLTAMAQRYGKSAAQVVLRWLIQQEGIVALSRTTNEARAAENGAIFDFELAPEDMAAIHALARPGSRIVSPAGLAPEWDPT